MFLDLIFRDDSVTNYVATVNINCGDFIRFVSTQTKLTRNKTNPLHCETDQYFICGILYYQHNGRNIHVPLFNWNSIW